MGRKVIGILNSIPAQGTIKSQALADFVAKLNPHPTKEEGSQWTLHVDSSCNSRSCGSGVVLEGPGDFLLEQALKVEFKTSNNQVENEAIIIGLNLALDLEVRGLFAKVTPNLLSVS